MTDIARSRSFYDRVFGWPAVIDMSGRIDEPGVRQSAEDFFGGVVYQHPSGTLFGLRPAGAERFDSERTGLDHVSFSVASRHDLVAAQRSFAEAGISRPSHTRIPRSGWDPPRTHRTRGG